MERYYKNDYTANKRTSRNHDLYKSIYEDQTYTNIEGIANIDRSNEVDIAKIKDLLKSREDYQSGRELKRFIPKENIKGISIPKVPSTPAKSNFTSDLTHVFTVDNIVS